MTYIGSNPITQYFLEGTDQFPVGSVSTTAFTLTRPVPTINSIAVSVGTTALLPTPANYTVSGNILTLATGVTNTTVYVRYLTSSSYAITPPAGSVNILSLAVTGSPSSATFLRGDGSWSGVGIPQNAQTAAYVLVASDLGKHISITTGGVTVPQNVFSIGDVVTIYNNSTSNQTITSGTGVTMYLAGTSTTGNRTLAQYGLGTILCVSGNGFVISGQGVS